MVVLKILAIAIVITVVAVVGLAIIDVAKVIEDSVNGKNPCDQAEAWNSPLTTWAIGQMCKNSEVAR